MAEDIGNIGGLLTPREDYVPNIQSVIGSIIQNAPDYQYFTAPLSNQGRTTATYGTTNNIVVAPDTPVRVVNNATGEVIYSGAGYEGAQAAIDAAKSLSSSTGKSANWDIQLVRPGGNAFESVSTDRPDVSGLGIAADIALPVAGSLLAGPLGLGALGLGTAGTAAAGAALGSGLSSAAQGRSLEDALLRAAIAGGGTYLGSQLFGATNPTGATVGENLPSWGALAAPYASAAEAAALTGATAGAGLGAIPSAAGDIVVTALGGVPALAGGAFGSLATGVVPSFFDSAQLSNTSTTSNNTNTSDQAGDIVVTANGGNSLVPLAGAGAVLGGGAALAGGATDAAITQNVNNAITTAEGNASIGAKESLSGTYGTTAGTAAAGAGGVLGTGLSLTQLAAITGIGVDLLGKIIGGGSGDEGATTPYTSPFGGGATLSLGGRTQVNPNIADYEKYGFGPEALFFSQGQNIPYMPPVSTAPTTTTTATTPTTTSAATPATTTTTQNTPKPTLLPNMISSLGANATSAEIEAALANAKTAEEATKINPGTVYFNIDTPTADALGDRGLVGDVMSIQQLQQAMAARELTDPNKYATNLYEQIGEQLSSGLLNIDQARAIQEQIRQELISSNPSTQDMQNIYNTAIQRYKPLI